MIAKGLVRDDVAVELQVVWELLRNDRRVAWSRPTRCHGRRQEKGGVTAEKSLSEERSAVGEALGRIASGCFILTVQDGQRSTGVLVSWVQQAAFEPPMVSVCLRSGRPAGELVEASGRFLLNVIGADPKPMFKHFGKGFTLEQDAFEGLTIEPTSYGPLISDCSAQLGCRVIQKVRVGDHDLYVAEVEAGRVDEGAQPYTHLRGNGFSY